MRFLPLLLLLACLPEHTPDCVSTCGAYVFGTRDCSGYDHREAVGLDVLSAHVGWDRDRMRHALTYWRTSIVQAQTYKNVAGQDVAGETWCDRLTIYLADRPWKTGALIHEMAHAMEGCSDPGHVHWQEKGIWDAIADGFGRE